MISLNSDPSTALKELIGETSVSSAIYVNGAVPTANLPNDFIEITQNGPTSSMASQLGTAGCTLIIMIYVRLLSNGGANYQKENTILGQFQQLFSGTIKKSGFSFSIDKRRMVYQGKSIVSGYSTKMLNIHVDF